MYTGYEKKYLSETELSDLYADGKPPLALKENQYFISADENGQPTDYFKFQDGKFKPIRFPSFNNDYTGLIKPRNAEQYCAMDLLKDQSIPIKLITGKFGSGKSLLCITGALEALSAGLFDRIIFVRNNVQVKDTDQLGALPGSEYEKTLPYLMPFADHCGGIDGVEQLIHYGQLEVIPLAFLRGRSITNSLMYVMEAENLTKQHLQLIMGRIDNGSQLWIDGDVKQRDKTAFEKSQGLECMIERLQGNRNFGYVHLIKSERSEVAALADLLD